VKYLSICSGIEAASVAWEPLGWEPVGFSEIEAFPRAVLEQRFPEVPLHGDFTLLIEDPPACDLLVGGTPCQAFSVAGRRLSLQDLRGNLSLAYVELANAIDRKNHAEGQQPCITVWENVPGVFSTGDNAFGCFLGALAGEVLPLEPPGGRWTNVGAVFGPQRAVAWRVLDAQYFGLAQRRRRVFVVSSARTGFDPTQVLFEWEGLRRDSPPGRKERQEAAAAFAQGAGAGVYLGNAEGGAGDVPFLTSSNLSRQANQQQPLVGVTGDIAHALRGEGFDASEDGTGRGTPVVAQGFPDPAGTLGGASQSGGSRTTDLDNSGAFVVAPALTSSDGGVDENDAVVLAFHPTQDCISSPDRTHAMGTGGRGQASIAIAFDTTQVAHPENRCNPQPGDACHPLAAQGHPPDLADGLVVRRLMPVECERLQGFPDRWTDVLIRGKPAKDSPRYKALGNSMAVPVMRWIGRRLELYLKHREVVPISIVLVATEPVSQGLLNNVLCDLASDFGCITELVTDTGPLRAQAKVWGFGRDVPVVAYKGITAGVVSKHSALVVCFDQAVPPAGTEAALRVAILPPIQVHPPLYSFEEV